MSLTITEIEDFKAVAVVLQKQIAKLETRIAELESPWIKVEDRLPDNDKEVLVYTISNIICIDSYNHIDAEWDYHHSITVPFWTPLPEPPK